MNTKSDNSSGIMKVWFEVLTGKQAIMFHHMALYLEERKGYQTIFTTRDYDFANKNLIRLGRDQSYLVGKYGGSTKYDKLIEGNKRIRQIAEILREEKPDVLVTLSSPNASHAAFGLGIPIIIINDAPSLNYSC